MSARIRSSSCSGIGGGPYRRDGRRDRRRLRLKQDLHPPPAAQLIERADGVAQRPDVARDALDGGNAPVEPPDRLRELVRVDEAAPDVDLLEDRVGAAEGDHGALQSPPAD